MKIKFFPTGQEIEVNPNKSLLQLCMENKIEIKSLCKGVPSCGECRIRIREGENSILPPTAKELHVLGSNYFLDGRRLACQVYCFGNVGVDLTEQLERGESKSKKIRGFRKRSGTEVQSPETHAQSGVFLLDKTSPKRT
jgi:2Fe-2S ferredoxin